MIDLHTQLSFTIASSKPRTALKALFLMVIFSAILANSLTGQAQLQPKPEPYRVIIDPGHGGHDHGATRGSTHESQLSLQFSKKLFQKLATLPSIQPLMTRQTNKTLSLKERTLIATEQNGDLFLSIHANASPDPRAKGAEFFIQNQLTPDQDSMFLAAREDQSSATLDDEIRPVKPYTSNTVVNAILEDVQNAKRVQDSSQFSKILAKNWRGTKKRNRYLIRQAPFYVVSYNRMPAVLIELGFLTNKRDRQLLTTSSYQDQLVDDIASSILEYKKQSQYTPAEL